MKRDGHLKSFWQDAGYQHQNTPPPTNDFDTIIVGAGLSGISIAMELQKRGKKCLVLEKNDIASGTSSGTTAHINNFFDCSYDQIIRNFGEKEAQIIAEHAQGVYHTIHTYIKKYALECDYEECDFYLFSAEKKQDALLRKIFEGHYKVSLPTAITTEFPFDIQTHSIIKIKGQAHFHPLKYIHGLFHHFEQQGGYLLTRALVEDYEKTEDGIRISLGKDKIFTAKNLVWATHVSPGNNRFNLLVAPYRSYALSAKMLFPPPKAAQAADLHEPYHYFRYHKKDHQYYLIIGGFDHKTGHLENTENSFQQLIAYAKEHFRIGEICEKWSSQYYVPADGLPYIGKMPGEENIYISTGYNGNGMTWGTLSAEVIADLIEGKENELAKIISPERIKIIASATQAIKENTDALLHFIKSQWTESTHHLLDEMSFDEGKVVEIEQKKVAVYKDIEGNFSFLSAVCPHMGCTVKFNKAEQSWDCPCHGSRFDTSGKLLNGPSTQGLEELQILKPSKTEKHEK